MYRTGEQIQLFHLFISKFSSDCGSRPTLLQIYTPLTDLLSISVDTGEQTPLADADTWPSGVTDLTRSTSEFLR